MACRIQRTFFNFIQMKKLRRFFKALKRIQSLMKVRTEVKKFRKTLKNTKQIQSAFKKTLFRRGVTSYFEKLDKMKEASNKIGSFAKMFKAKSMYQDKKTQHYIIMYCKNYGTSCMIGMVHLEQMLKCGQ